MISRYATAGLFLFLLLGSMLAWAVTRNMFLAGMCVGEAWIVVLALVSEGPETEDE